MKETVLWRWLMDLDSVGLGPQSKSLLREKRVLAR
jgi:hypothetical protein